MHWTLSTRQVEITDSWKSLPNLSKSMSSGLTERLCLKAKVESYYKTPDIDFWPVHAYTAAHKYVLTHSITKDSHYKYYDFFTQKSFNCACPFTFLDLHLGSWVFDLRLSMSYCIQLVKNGDTLISSICHHKIVFCSCVFIDCFLQAL